MSTSPLIYSELLSNIRQISVITALDTPCNASTKVELSLDGRQFILSHDGNTETLDLPGQVAPSAQLLKPVIGSTELSWRLPLAAQPSRSSEDAQSNDAPWSAASLAGDVEFSCRECGAVVVKSGSIETWKDLPSENWAEMMDFWHCHKPDVPHTHGSSDQPPVPDKGYGPSSRFAAQSGVGFVDLTTFLLFDADCVGIKSSPTPPASDTQSTASPTPLPPPTYQPLTCASCTNYLGYHDPQGEGTRLYKWRLSLSFSSYLTSKPTSTPSPTIIKTITTHPVPSNPSLATILSAHLLSIVHSQCVSRILILPYPLNFSTSSASNSNPNPLPAAATPLSTAQAGAKTKAAANALSLWIFAPTLRFSSSLLLSTTPGSTFNSNHDSNHKANPASKLNLKSQPTTTSTTQSNRSSNKSTLAAKIFYQPISISAHAALLEKGNVEELYLPSEAISELQDVLRRSGDVLPPSARKFQLWDVGLLERFEG